MKPDWCQRMRLQILQSSGVTSSSSFSGAMLKSVTKPCNYCTHWAIWSWWHSSHRNCVTAQQGRGKQSTQLGEYTAPTAYDMCQHQFSLYRTPFCTHWVDMRCYHSTHHHPFCSSQNTTTMRHFLAESTNTEKQELKYTNTCTFKLHAEGKMASTKTPDTVFKT